MTAGAPWAAGVGALDADIRILDRVLANRVGANQAIAGPSFVHGSRAEDVNVLDREQTIVLILIGAESWHARAAAREREELPAIRKEELCGDGVALVQVVIEVRIELIFIGDRDSRTRIMAIGLRRRNYQRSVWQPRVQQRQCDRIDRGRERSVRQLRFESREQLRLRTIVSQSGRDQDTRA